VIIKKLSLANFRGFEQIELDFGPAVNVIVGINGSGKTGILRALAVTLSRLLPEITPADPRMGLSFVDEDIRSGRSFLTVSVELEHNGTSFVKAGVRRQLDAARKEDLLAQLEALTFKIVKDKPDRSQRREWKYERDRITKLLNEQGDQWDPLMAKPSNRPPTDARVGAPIDRPAPQQAPRPGRNHPIALYIPVGRYLPRYPRKLSAASPADLHYAYAGALIDLPRTVDEFVDWFHAMESLPGRGAKRRRATLASLRSAVEGFDRTFTNLRLIHEPLRLIVDKVKVPLSIGQLSDGERGLLCIYFEIARRLSVANPLSNEPLIDGTGVVLLDEIELHLHPRWQRVLIESLRTTFPRVQFLATTHSPFIVQSLREDELINLDGQSVPKTDNLSVERIAEGLMGVDRADVGKRYEQMVAAAKDYLVALETAAKAPAEKLAEFERKLAERVAPYADNPAFQAFLELKHAAKLGTNEASADQPAAQGV
jgi:predicted ATP-binding protein involved in virulence